jgi:hypothetical protein
MWKRAQSLVPVVVLVLAGGCDPVKPAGQKDAAVQPDTGPGPDGTVECQEGARKCEANILMICDQGHWQQHTICQGTCDPVEGCTSVQPNDVLSYIWISNTGENTVSKVDTRTATEVGRYYTCGNGYCDPSRTSVNLHGDAVVVNRSATPSSVTKFAAARSDCIDRNGNGTIDTSTGPNDVKPWGQDECMLWHTPFPTLPQFPGDNHGARGTSWDGTEDPFTGEGGYVWVGTCTWGGGSNMVFKFNGDHGMIEDWKEVPGMGCAYGGAMDGHGSFWIYDFTASKLHRLDTLTFEAESFSVSCGYGITTDPQGRVWLGGSGLGGNCVSRFDPVTATEQYVTVPGAEFLRGISVGLEKSEGYAWAADTGGTLFQIDLESVTVAGSYVIAPGSGMIGSAVDFQGYVWTVSQSTPGVAYKFDLDSETFTSVTIGSSPYTYSDMTGMQLRNVVPVE